MVKSASKLINAGKFVFGLMIGGGLWSAVGFATIAIINNYAKPKPIIFADIAVVIVLVFCLVRFPKLKFEIMGALAFFAAVLLLYGPCSVLILF